jgi:glycosyltransferase involved in cell wall biosynthesis
MDFNYLDHQFYGNPTIPANPKVSICVITYNHEKYIETCLTNILNQKVNFEYEIIIGEDHSTDQTAEIIKKYADLHPNLIKAYIRPKNVGAKINFLHCFFDCKGEYIVHIEADDYFTDDQKLQNQVDFLDANPQASACFHNAEIIYEDDTNRASETINPIDQKKWTETKDFFEKKETWFMATASVMMRKKYVSTLPEWFFQCKSGDIPLYSILAEAGPIGYIDKLMSVYRKNLNGLSYTDHTQSIEFIKNRIFMYSKINEYTQYKYDSQLKPILKAYHIMAMQCLEISPSFLAKISYLIKAYLLVPPSHKKEVFYDLKYHLMGEKNLYRYLKFREKLNMVLGLKKKGIN